MATELCAMILAAGRGERMRPLTDRVPKPLIEVRGKPLIVHHIEKLVAIGVRRIVINVSYRAADIRAALGDGAQFGCDIIYSEEVEPLETGGGVATAAPWFDQPQFVLASADVFSDIDYQKFASIARDQWSVEKNSCKAHFFAVPRAPDRPGGEFALSSDGRLNEGQPRHTLANVMLIRTELVTGWPAHTRFALLPHYRDWVSRGWVSGELHTGEWCNVTSPADVERLNQSFAPR